MGQYIDGVWHGGWDLPISKGAFERAKTAFRSRISLDGSTPFPAEAGRYHLYVSPACPWAHRVLVTRALRGLEDVVSASVVEPRIDDDGWVFSQARPDALFGSARLGEIYVRAAPKYTGRVTVPVLWDRVTGNLVSNESRDIMRMLDTVFDEHARGPTLAPPALLPRIDAMLDALYDDLNNGVYRAGFATTQAAYETACRGVFDALDRLDSLLGTQRYVCGDTLTEADLALFTTLLRFDLVYYSHFKCNVRRVRDYANLHGFLRELFQQPQIRSTCALDEIKTHYYWSQTNLNPHRIVQHGPSHEAELDAPHDRERLGGGRR